MKEINKKSVLIGYKLKQLRLKRGYTQSRIAEVLGVSSQHYGTLERGINSFSLDNILKLCDFYNVSVMSILGELRTADRKKKKECEKLISQIEELGDEHKEVVTHMVKYYRQLERKDVKKEDNISNASLNRTNKLEEMFQDEPLYIDNKEEELAQLIDNLENEIKVGEKNARKVKSNNVSSKKKNALRK